MRSRLRVIVFFVLGALCALAWWMPVHFVIDLVDPGEEGVHLEAATGSVSSGSLVFTSPQVQALPIGWRICWIDLPHPLGLCIDMSKANTRVAFGVVPWNLGERLTLHNVAISSPLADLSRFGPGLSALALVKGNITTDLTRLVYDRKLRVLRELQGTARFDNISAVGLNLGDIDVKVTQEQPGGEINIMFEGGDINEMVLLGNGTLEPQSGKLTLRTVFRSNKPSLLNQLGSFAKKIGENSYEWNFTTSL